MTTQSSQPQWTKTSLTTLMHALTLSPPDAPSLLPHTSTQISSTLRKISLSLNNPPNWTPQRHARAVLKRATGLSPPPKPRRKKSPPAPKHRISLQLIPATPRDDIAVRAVGAYPFVEVVLKAGRRVWDVVKHLYDKWGLPVRVELNGKPLSVDSLVVELVERGCRTVRLPYRLIKVDIDWRVLKCALEDDVISVAGKRRVVAPRDDESFWTGHFDALPSGSCSQDMGAHGSQEGEDRNGEEAVMSRLRGHLEKLDQTLDVVEAEVAVTENRKEGEETIGRGSNGDGDPAEIPERFLRSCSRFEFGHTLPDSLLSLGKSDGSGDGRGGGGVGNVVNAPVRNCTDAGRTDIVDANPLQVMNDALDLRHELDLRCDEELDGVDFLHPGLTDVPAPSLSLSAFFRE